MLIVRCLRACSHPYFRGQSISCSRLHLRIPRRMALSSHHNQGTNSRTKQDTSSYGTAQKPVSREQQRPFASIVNWFSQSQSRRPYTTQLCLTPVIFCLGDFSAQLIGDDDFDYRRSLRSIIIGLVIAIPSHEWFLFLGRRFNYSSPSLSLGAKVAVNQAVYTPLFNVYFFASHGLLAGDGIRGATQRVKDKASISIPRSFLFWPVVTAFNFSYISPQSRSIVTSIFSVFWQSYLSWLNSSAGVKRGNFA